MNDQIEMSDDFFKMSDDLLQIIRHIVWWVMTPQKFHELQLSSFNPLGSQGTMQLSYVVNTMAAMTWQ